MIQLYQAASRRQRQNSRVSHPPILNNDSDCMLTFVPRSRFGNSPRLLRALILLSTFSHHLHAAQEPGFRRLPGPEERATPARSRSLLG